MQFSMRLFHLRQHRSQLRQQRFGRLALLAVIPFSETAFMGIGLDREFVDMRIGQESRYGIRPFQMIQLLAHHFIANPITGHSFLSLIHHDQEKSPDTNQENKQRTETDGHFSIQIDVFPAQHELSPFLMKLMHRRIKFRPPCKLTIKPDTTARLKADTNE